MSNKTIECCFEDLGGIEHIAEVGKEFMGRDVIHIEWEQPGHLGVRFGDDFCVQFRDVNVIYTLVKEIHE